MAVFPKKKDQPSALDRARAALGEINVKLADLLQQREARLIAGDPASEIAKLDAQIEELRHAARTEQDRIELLEQQAEREKHERRTAHRMLL